MENLGSLALLLAFCLAVYAAVGSVVGRAKRRPFLVHSAGRAVYVIWALVTLASGILVFSIVTGDFRFAYVAAHSNRAMPMLYKVAAWWGGQEGSLLFWSWLLATYAAVVVTTNRRKHRDMMPWVTGVMMAVQSFFLLLNNFVANPFQMLAVDRLITAVPDGNGLSPLLQYPAGPAGVGRDRCARRPASRPCPSSYSCRHPFHRNDRSCSGSPAPRLRSSPLPYERSQYLWRALTWAWDTLRKFGFMKPATFRAWVEFPERLVGSAWSSPKERVANRLNRKLKIVLWLEWSRI